MSIYIKKVLPYLKYTFIILCLFYLLVEIDLNLSQLKNTIHSNLKDFLIVFFFLLLFHNLINLRYYFFLKYGINYLIKFTLWSEIFFYTSLLNKFFFLSGHIFRAVELKKKKVEFKTFIALNFTVVVLDIILSLLLFLFIILKKFEIIFIIFLYVLYKLFYIFINHIKKKLPINIFLNFLYQTFLIVSKIFKSHFNTLIFTFFTVIIIFIEFYIFNLIMKNFIEGIQPVIVFYIYFVYIVLKRIPIISDIPGLNETILALYGTLFSVSFTEIYLPLLILRLMNYIAILFSYIFYKLLFLFNNKF